MSLLRYVYAQACNNAWSNLRLLRACARLTEDEFAAPRVSFFPSLRATLGHNLAVDHYYVDALERCVQGRGPNRRAQEFFDPSAEHSTCSSLWEAQRAVDQRLIRFCGTLNDESLAATVLVPIVAGVRREPMFRLLAHLFLHQIHHRGQAHSMLAGTAVPPPQLDEFFCVGDAALRADELAELGLSEGALWGPRSD